MATIRTMALKDVRFDGETQMRFELNGEVVREYSEAMQQGAEFPPIVVFFDGSHNWIGDGYHRWHAARNAGFDEFACEVHQGTRRDAILFACGVNAAHGIRRNNLDKRKAVTTLLKDEEWSKWSDNVIAQKCGVSHPFVGKLREQLVTVTTSPSRRGADGKSYRLPQRKENNAGELAEDRKPLAPTHVIATPDDDEADSENLLDKCDSTQHVTSAFIVPEPDKDVLQDFIPYWNGLTAKQRRTIRVWIMDKE